MIGRTCIGHHQQQGVHHRIVPLRGQQADRVGRAVDPQIVAVDAQERLVAQQRQRAREPPARFHQLIALVRDHDVEIARARRQMRLDRVRQIMDVDHDAAHTGRAQPVEHMIEKRLAGHLDQRLGACGGERPHALAQARGHHHRGGRHRAARIGAQGQRPRHAATSTSGSPRLSRGTFCSNQRATGISAGWRRSRSRYAHTRGHSPA